MVGSYEKAILNTRIDKELDLYEAWLTRAGKYRSLGSAVGSTVAFFIPGTPAEKAAYAAGLSWIGGEIGTSAAGDTPEGVFFQSDREEGKKAFSNFGTENLALSLESGLKAGMGAYSQKPNVEVNKESMNNAYDIWNLQPSGGNFEEMPAVDFDSMDDILLG